MSNVIHVTQQQFEQEVLRSELPVVVDFYADWCPPCRALGPILDRLSLHFDGQIKFVKINSDQEQGLAGSFNISALPTVVLMDQGKAVGQFSGLPREDGFRDELQRWIDSRVTR